VLATAAISSDAGAHLRNSGSGLPGPSTHLQVTQIEYHLLLSEAVVKAGPVSLEEIDGGMDQHDLRLRHQGSSHVIGEPLLSPGERWDGVVDLKPGLYHLWCSLPQHKALGMHAILKVVR
jgi:hypothetical protein